MNCEFDVIVIGGGAVGASFAAALLGQGMRVALVDAQAPAVFDPGAEMDLRVFALSRASRRILAAVGAWPDVAAGRVAPYREMYVWDAAGSGHIHFDSADLGEPELGYIVENRLLQHALWARLGKHQDVVLLYPVRPASVQVEDDGVRVTLDDGRRLTARLLVGADGADSRTRTLCGIAADQESYGQRALVAHLRTTRPHRDTAWQRFLPTGPVALLPLSDGRVSLVWSADESQAAKLLALDDDAFCREVTAATEAKLGEAVSTTPRAAFPLRRMQAREYVRPRIALAGDAAHAVHPLAGQGMNLGLLDAASLAQVVCAAHREGRDIGDTGVLRRYERWRKSENLAMIWALDGFKRLFGSEFAPAVMLRNAGLNAVDRFTPLKRAFALHATGLSGDLPDLARAKA